MFSLFRLRFFSPTPSIDFGVIASCAFVIGIATSIFLTTNSALLLQHAPQDQDSLRFAQSMRVVSENLGNSCSMLLIMFFAAQYYVQIFEVIGLFFLLFALNTMKYLHVEKSALEQSFSDNNESKQAGHKQTLLITTFAVFIAGIIYGQQRIAYPLFLNETFSMFYDHGNAVLVRSHYCFFISG